MKTIFAFSFLPLLSLMPAAVYAEVLTFSNVAIYEAAVGVPSLLLDFDGVPGNYSSNAAVDGDFFDSRIEFRSPEASSPDKVVRFLDGIGDAGSTVSSNSVGPLEGLFHVPAKAFGLFFSEASSPETVELFGVDDTPLGSITTTSANGFFGALSDIAIGRWVIRNGSFGGSSRDRFKIDNFQASLIPEPTTLLLAATASLTLLTRRRRSVGC